MSRKRIPKKLLAAGIMLCTGILFLLFGCMLLAPAQQWGTMLVSLGVGTFVLATFLMTDPHDWGHYEYDDEYDDDEEGEE